jgi:flagellar hook-basal body complex protein FliE
MTPLAPVVSLSQVASAYGGSAIRAPGGDSAANAAGGSFAGMAESAAENALQTLRSAEQTTARGVVGRADVQDVVQALSNAEVTMQTVVAVRDKVLSAYNDVMHMAV